MEENLYNLHIKTTHEKSKKDCTTPLMIQCEKFEGMAAKCCVSPAVLAQYS